MSSPPSNVRSNKHNHILDHLFTRDGYKISPVSAVSVDFPTDHTILFFNIYTNLLHKKIINRKVYDYITT